MIVARRAEELPATERAIALGSFDGVHIGHRSVLEAAQAAGLTTTVVTFWPHPRTVLGNRVELLTTLERRLELLAEAGMDARARTTRAARLRGVAPQTHRGTRRRRGRELPVRPWRCRDARPAG